MVATNGAYKFWYLIFQDLFTKLSNESNDLQSHIVDRRSDIVLSVKVVSPGLIRDFASPAQTQDDVVPLKTLKKNIKLRRE